jgi:peroxiredoxin
MMISVGDTVPDVTFKNFSGEGLGTVATGVLFAGRRILLAAFPARLPLFVRATTCPAMSRKTETSAG